MKQFVPELFDTMRTYSAKQFGQDVIAGIIVAIVALPLSIALALASGVGPQEGIYTAIVAGFLISFFGGSRVQIAGPTAAFATIVAGIIARNGMEGMIAATMIAGIILILMGVFKIGMLIKFIPYTITTGFTTGIAVTIVIGQLKDFLGLTYPAGLAPVETMEKLHAVTTNIGTFNYEALLIGLLSLVILFGWPRISQKIPSSLVAVVVGTAVVFFMKLEVNTIGDLYTISNSLPHLHMPKLTYAVFKAEISDGMTIAILAAIESLLSCVVADSMVGTKHKSNQELIAQGIGNIGSALFGGIPATGAIARTAANIRNGGRTPVAGMVHALTLLLVLIFLIPYAALIPMPTIAAILFQVAYNMCGIDTFVRICRKAPKSDVAVLISTMVLTVVFDLVVAIEIGMVAACVLFMKRMSDEFTVEGWKYLEELDEDDDENIELRHVPKYVRVYDITGPMFFGATDVLHQIEIKDFTKVMVLRMRAVPAIDASALVTMREFLAYLHKHGVVLVLSHVNDQPRQVMAKSGYDLDVGLENFKTNIDEALEWAEELGLKMLEEEKRQKEEKHHKDNK